MWSSPRITCVTRMSQSSLTTERWYVGAVRAQEDEIFQLGGPRTGSDLLTTSSHSSGSSPIRHRTTKGSLGGAAHGLLAGVPVDSPSYFHSSGFPAALRLPPGHPWNRSSGRRGPRRAACPRLAVKFLALGLVEGALVPVHAEPGQALQDAFGHLGWTGPRRYPRCAG